jgi:hypothetical protein
MNPMKKMYALAIVLLILNLPLQAGAVCSDLSENDIREARAFTELHKKNTGIVLNNMYSIGGDQLFSERIIVRTKWHKLALLYMVKSHGSELTEAEKEAVLEDPNLQIDIILFGHSLGFAKECKAVISQGALHLEPEKLHADHFQVINNMGIHSGFPDYRATLRTYFDLKRIDTSKPFSLILIRDGREESFPIDLKNFR